MQQNHNIFNCRIDTIELKKGNRFIYKTATEATTKRSQKNITLFIIKRGLVELRVNNNTWNLFEKYSLTSDSHHFNIGISANHNDADVKLISFDLDLLLRLGLTNRLLYNAHQWLFENKHRVWITKTDIALQAIELVEKANQNKSANPMNQESMICALKIFIYEIIALLKIPERPSIFSSRKQALYADFYNLVMQHYKEEHKVNFYADKLCITVKYLSDVTKSQSGKTASDIINTFVINEAKKLLESGANSISQISDLLNFSDQFTFGKFFKKKTGLSPRNYLTKIN